MKTYKGLDVIYSEDEGGYYAQDFSQDKQPVSKLYPSFEALKKAIDSGKIKMK